MANPQGTPSMALFCDFENVALGVRDAKYEKFDIRKVLERLLLKGSIVVKKAYCDWDRYREFKTGMHEASFEMIEIPHVRQSGKNSADIRMVVDALDLCYTKTHVDTFVIISGDSDFSPLVSKLRENNKTVIGVGVKGSTSDLLTANCDEFIFYDDLVREQRRRGVQNAARREAGRDGGRDGGRSPANGRPPERERDRDRDREPVRTAPPVPTMPPLLVPAPTQVSAADLAGADDTPHVGGPWRRHVAEPAARAAAGVAEPDPSETPPPATDEPAVAVEAAAPATDDAVPAAPARRKRRPRGAAAAVEPLDFAATVTAAEIAAADGFMTPTVADAAESGPVEAAPPEVPAGDPESAPADAPKKRAPRRRKTAADAAPAEPAAAPAEPAPERAAPAPEPEPAPRVQRSDEDRRQEAVDLVLETVEALITERGADDKIWGSMVKQTLKRRRPGFAESYYGFRSFNELLEDARDRGLLALDHDEKSGGYVIRLL
jgi:uncharacterized protein (TIGR00288 family)